MSGDCAAASHQLNYRLGAGRVQARLANNFGLPLSADPSDLNQPFSVIHA
jgi:hypothetical protein